MQVKESGRADDLRGTVDTVTLFKVQGGILIYNKKGKTPII